MQPEDLGRVRQFCSDEDKVFGAMAAITRHPYKFLWYERYAAELYDLSWDREERSNQAPLLPDLAHDFVREIERFVEESGLAGESASAGALSDDAAEALRALGYVE